MQFETILDERRGQDYIARGLWANRTLMDVFDEHVARQPDKTVLVDARLYDVEPLAYKFMVNFANDNNLQIEWMGDAPL